MKQLKLYINGEWLGSESQKSFKAYNPATGEVIAEVAEGTRADAGKAAEAAHAAQPAFARWTNWERSQLCLRIADTIERRSEELAQVVAEEQGKPFHTEAKAEIATAITGFREAAELIKWLESSFIPVEHPDKRVYTMRQPRGVYAVITPWNFPVNIPVEYLAPGIAAGNAMVWVPAPSTSVCAVKLMECLIEAGVPDGIVNLVTGEGAVVGDEIVGHRLTNAVGFTGSSVTGEHIARRAAAKPLLLELGGNGPTIVFEDADLDTAAEAIAAGCFFNSGQTCSATERILVHQSVASALAEKIAGHAKQLRVGNPLDPDVTTGPLNNEKTAAKVDRLLEDAVAKGAQIITGGSRLPQLGSPLFYGPTVVLNVSHESALSAEECFGPVAPLILFNSEEEALQMANDDDLGLSAAVWTSNMGRAIRCAEALKIGSVHINENSLYWEIHVPFGGASGKRSGVGRLGGKHTIMEMTDLKTISFDVTRA